MIRASASYTSGWGSFVLLEMDSVRVAQGGSLSTLHRGGLSFVSTDPPVIKVNIHWKLHSVTMFQTKLFQSMSIPDS